MVELFGLGQLRSIHLLTCWIQKLLIIQLLNPWGLREWCRHSVTHSCSSSSSLPTLRVRFSRPCMASISWYARICLNIFELRCFLFLMIDTLRSFLYQLLDIYKILFIFANLVYHIITMVFSLNFLVQILSSAVLQTVTSILIIKCSVFTQWKPIIRVV